MLNIRKQIEENELKNLSDKASFACKSRGRQFEDDECSLRTCYQKDRDRIIHSKSFRRLIGKTQVFIAPYGSHLRVRLTHTFEVNQIARTIARALKLNEDLTEAISLAHDLGHTPFGHLGEKFLISVFDKEFHHSKQSLRVVDKLEKKGKGLNLSAEVRDGIVKHSKKITGIQNTVSGSTAITLEGNIVRISDSIAYLNHDIDDAIRLKKLKLEDIPKETLKILGDNHAQRINTMVSDVIENSMNKDVISMSPEILEATNNLRLFLFNNVYLVENRHPSVDIVKKVLRRLWEYYIGMSDSLENFHGDNAERVVADYIAGMTDIFAIRKYVEITGEDLGELYFNCITEDKFY